MTMRIFVSRDAGAIAVGADEVALALEAAARNRSVGVEIVRTGSRGLYWLEPMIEVAGPQGRIAFGPVTVADAQSVLDAMAADGPHALRLGVTMMLPLEGGLSWQPTISSAAASHPWPFPQPTTGSTLGAEPDRSSHWARPAAVDSARGFGGE